MIVMKTFVCIILIPALTGILTAANGASFLNPDELSLALMINIPICLVSTAIHYFTE
jgi:hypothetical protein